MFFKYVDTCIYLGSVSDIARDLIRFLPYLKQHLQQQHLAAFEVVVAISVFFFVFFRYCYCCAVAGVQQCLLGVLGLGFCFSGRNHPLATCWALARSLEMHSLRLPLNSCLCRNIYMCLRCVSQL